MTNLELQELLKQYPDDWPIFIPCRSGEFDYFECNDASLAPKTPFYDNDEYEEEKLIDCIQLDYE